MHSHLWLSSAITANVCAGEREREEERREEGRNRGRGKEEGGGRARLTLIGAVLLNSQCLFHSSTLFSAIGCLHGCCLHGHFALWTETESF